MNKILAADLGYEVVRTLDSPQIGRSSFNGLTNGLDAIYVRNGIIHQENDMAHRAPEMVVEIDDRHLLVRTFPLDSYIVTGLPRKGAKLDIRNNTQVTELVKPTYNAQDLMWLEIKQESGVRSWYKSGSEKLIPNMSFVGSSRDDYHLLKFTRFVGRAGHAGMTLGVANAIKKYTTHLYGDNRSTAPEGVSHANPEGVCAQIIKIKRYHAHIIPLIVGDLAGLDIEDFSAGAYRASMRDVHDSIGKKRRRAVGSSRNYRATPVPKGIDTGVGSQSTTQGSEFVAKSAEVSKGSTPGSSTDIKFISNEEALDKVRKPSKITNMSELDDEATFLNLNSE